MSDWDEQLIAALRRNYEAFNRGDFDTAVKLAHPEIEFVRPGGQSSLRGADALRAWMEPDAFEEQMVEPHDFTVAENKVLVEQTARAKGAGSGLEMEIRSWAVWTFDDAGLVTRLEFFLHHQGAEARAAAGLRE